MKEPGQMLYEAISHNKPWSLLTGEKRYPFARVESAIRADERAKVIEECAKIVESGVGEYIVDRTPRAIAAAIRAKGAEHG